MLKYFWGRSKEYFLFWDHGVNFDAVKIVRRLCSSVHDARLTPLVDLLFKDQNFNIIHLPIQQEIHHSPQQPLSQHPSISHFLVTMTNFNSSDFTRYASVHQNTKGAGDARPTALQIVKDNDVEGKLTDKVVIVTGCSAGIGIETARAMKATGAHVYATARNLTKGQKALEGILEPGKVDLLLLDLESLESVRSFAAEFLEKSSGKLNLLITNAGVMATPEGRTKDGFETQIGTNHLAHFLLFQLLKPALLASSTPDFHSRVVTLTSNAHRFSGIHFDNLNLEGEYDPGMSYGQSKTANIYMATEIERRYGAQGLHGLSCHPGGIFETSGLGKHVGDAQLEEWKKIPGMLDVIKSAPQGAATTVWAAVGKVWEGTGGKYLEDCQVSAPVKDGTLLMAPGHADWVYDQKQAERLWEVSNKLVGIIES